MNTTITMRIVFILYIIILIPFVVFNLPIRFLFVDSLLAYIPLEIFIFMKKKSYGNTNPFLLFLYILFIPNNAYLLTDLIHLSRIAFYTNSSAIMTENSFIWVMFVIEVGGILSLYILGIESEYGLLNNFSKKYSWSRITDGIVNTFLFFLISIGIFFGRFLRFNTTTLFIHPTVILKGTLKLFHFESLIFILVFTILQKFLYLILSSKNRII